MFEKKIVLKLFFAFMKSGVLTTYTDLAWVTEIIYPPNYHYVKCPYSKLFWSVFPRIRTEYGEILRISPYSVLMRENTDQNNSEYGHFLRSDMKGTRKYFDANLNKSKKMMIAIFSFQNLIPLKYWSFRKNSWQLLVAC